MLGLSNACSSNIYIPFSSTRSLTLDGSNDYLDTGRTFATTFAGAFSISLWIKPSDGRPSSAEMLFGSQNASGEDLVWGRVEDDTESGDAGKILFYFKSNNSSAVGFKTDAPVFTDGPQDWHHIVFTADLSGGDNTTFAIYVDGSAVAATMTNLVTVAEHANFATDTNLYVGAKNDDGSLTSPFAGGIDEFAIWNTVLSNSDALAIYNNGSPTNLTSPRGAYSASNASALQVWYRMGDGSFDDLDQAGSSATLAAGFITDQHDPGFGSDLFDSGEGTFDSGTGSWTAYGSNSIANVGSQLTITYADNALGARVRFADSKDLSTDLTVGKTYVVKFDAKYVGGSGNSYIEVDDGAGAGSGDGAKYITNDLTTEMKTYKLYFHCAHATEAYIRPRDMDGTGSNTVITIDNISIREVNGYPGLLRGSHSSFSDDFSNEFN